MNFAPIMSWIPGYPHVGPGNQILEEASNSPGNITRDHDIAYDRVKTEEDIRK